MIKENSEFDTFIIEPGIMDEESNFIQIPTIQTNDFKRSHNKFYRGNQIYKIENAPDMSSINLMQVFVFENTTQKKNTHTKNGLKQYLDKSMKKNRENNKFQQFDQVFSSILSCEVVCSGIVKKTYNEIFLIIQKRYPGLLENVISNSSLCFKYRNKRKRLDEVCRSSCCERNVRKLNNNPESTPQCKNCIDLDCILRKIKFHQNNQRLLENQLKYLIDFAKKRCDFVFKEKTDQIVVNNDKFVEVNELTVEKPPMISEFKRYDNGIFIKDGKREISVPIPKKPPKTKFKTHFGGVCTLLSHMKFNINKDDTKAKLEKVLKESQGLNKKIDYKLRKKSDNPKTLKAREDKFTEILDSSRLGENFKENIPFLQGNKMEIIIPQKEGEKPFITKISKIKDKKEELNKLYKKFIPSMDMSFLSKTKYWKQKRNEGTTIHKETFNNILEEKNNFIDITLLETKLGSFLSNFREVLPEVKSLFNSLGLVDKNPSNPKLKNLMVGFPDGRPFKMISNFAMHVKFMDVIPSMVHCLIALFPIFFAAMTETYENLSEFMLCHYGLFDMLFSWNSFSFCICSDEKFISVFLRRFPANNAAIIDGGQYYNLLLNNWKRERKTGNPKIEYKKNCWLCGGQDCSLIFRMCFSEIVFMFKDFNKLSNFMLCIDNPLRIIMDSMHGCDNNAVHFVQKLFLRFYKIDFVESPDNLDLCYNLRETVREITKQKDWNFRIVKDKKKNFKTIEIDPFYPDTVSYDVLRNFSKLTSLIVAYPDHEDITCIFEENPFKIDFIQYLSPEEKSLYSQILSYRNENIVKQKLSSVLIEIISERIKKKNLTNICHCNEGNYCFIINKIVEIECIENGTRFRYFVCNNSIFEFGKNVQTFFTSFLENDFSTLKKINVVECSGFIWQIIGKYSLNCHFPSTHKAAKHWILYVLFWGDFIIFQMQSSEHKNIEDFLVYLCCKSGTFGGKTPFRKMFEYFVRKLKDLKDGTRNDLKETIIRIKREVNPDFCSLMDKYLSKKQLQLLLKELGSPYSYNKDELIKMYVVLTEAETLDFRFKPFTGNYLDFIQNFGYSEDCEFYKQYQQSKIENYENIQTEKIFIKII